MEETYDALVSRLRDDSDEFLRVTRTRRGVTLENAMTRLELVGNEADFNRYVFSLSNEAKSSFGHQDGMALLLTYIQESMDSDSAFSARWRFTTNKFNEPIVEETPLES